MPEKGLVSRVEGFVLAGGRARRFGADKALAVLGGAPLLAHALSSLAVLGLDARVVAADSAPYAALARGFVTSERPGRGPAEGLRAALEACRAPWALVLATDMPGIGAPALGILLAALPDAGADDGPRAVCFGEASGRRHPLPGLYHRSLVEVFFRPPEPVSLQQVLDLASARVLPAEAGGLGGEFANVNTPADLVRLEEGPADPLSPRRGPSEPESD